MNDEERQVDESADETVSATDTPRSGLSWFAWFGERLFWGPAILLFLLLTALFLAREAAYILFGVPAWATVAAVKVEPIGQEVEGQTHQGPRSYRHQVKYHYRDQAGVTHQGELTETTTTSQTSFARGQKINVEYLRYSPQTSRFIASWSTDQNWAGLLLLLILAACVLGCTAWLAARGDIHLWALRWRAMRWLGGNRHRAKLRHTPFPIEWESYLHRNFALYQHLTQPEREKLQVDVRIFVAEKRWEGCNGLVVTEEMKVTVAAQACVLLLGMEHDFYATVRTILLYPTVFQLRQETQSPGGVTREGVVPLLGQAWRRGPVLLAWDEALAGARDPQDGRNVVYHEFAHQLDFMGELGSLQHHTPERLLYWRSVIRSEFERLVNETQQGRATLLDKYGAQNEMEFFAVATECFFEQPVLMRHRHPLLYDLFLNYYGQDAAARFSAPSGRMIEA